MEKKQIIIPKGPALIILVGPSGAGKSTFTREHFEDREVVSSDDIRIWLTGQMERQDKNPQVFEEFHRRIEARLKSGQRVVADATHLRDGDRKRTAEIGFMLDVPTFYVVINRPVEHKMRTGGWRNDVRMKGGVTLIEAHEMTFVANEAKILAGDHQKWVTVIDTRDENQTITAAQYLPRDNVTSPARWLQNQGYNKIRVVADVHGNYDGLTSILSTVTPDTFMLFLGDVVDYGYKSWECVSLIHQIVSLGKGVMVRGNHDRKMTRYIEQTMNGVPFSGQINFGMDISTNQLKAMHPRDALGYQRKFLSLIEQSPDWIEMGEWMFAHAAIDAKMFGNSLFRSHRNSYLETMALYGESDGTKDDRGFPNRTYGWIEKMPTRKNAVLGHQIMSTVAPVVRKTPTGGQIVFLDTGSSKEGFLSFFDFDIKDDGIIPSEEFGRE